jgi:hypothetical protein
VGRQQEERRMSRSIAEQIKEAERELALRRNFYKKQVARQLMTEELALSRIELMESILESLRLLQAPVPELQGCFPVVLYFRTEADRQELRAAVEEAMPNLVARNL